METTLSNRKPRSGKWGLFDLLAMVGGVMPPASAIAALKGTGASILGYLLVVPPAIAVGVAILWLQGKIATAIVKRTDDCSKRVKDVVGFSVFLVQMLWIAIGGFSGLRLAAFITNHLKS